MKRYLKEAFIVLVSFIITIFPAISFSQFKYREVSNETSIRSTNRNDEISIRKAYFNTGKNLIEFLPRNYSKRGNVDYTIYLQKGIDNYKNIIMPDFPILINETGLVLKSNSNLLFQKNSKLIMKANNKQLYGLLYLENVKNVNIFYPNLVGDRFQHQTTKGEWGMGIFIRSSENINIVKPIIKRMWGDGIYIGNFGEKFSKNIKITNGVIDENRRNGISIIAGIDIEIKNCIISNTYGTAPEYGIDIEPNNPNEVLSNIVLSNNLTFNNKGGVLFALDKLMDSNSKAIDVTLLNHKDQYSSKGVEFYLNRYSNKKGKIEGNIKIENLSIIGSTLPLLNNKSFNSKVILKATGIKINGKPVSGQLVSKFGKLFEEGAKSELINEIN